MDYALVSMQWHERQQGSWEQGKWEVAWKRITVHTSLGLSVWITYVKSRHGQHPNSKDMCPELLKWQNIFFFCLAVIDFLSVCTFWACSSVHNLFFPHRNCVINKVEQQASLFSLLSLLMFGCQTSSTGHDSFEERAPECTQISSRRYRPWHKEHHQFLN